MKHKRLPISTFTVKNEHFVQHKHKKVQIVSLFERVENIFKKHEQEQADLFKKVNPVIDISNKDWFDNAHFALEDIDIVKQDKETTKINVSRMKPQRLQMLLYTLGIDMKAIIKGHKKTVTLQLTTIFTLSWLTFIQICYNIVYIKHEIRLQIITSTEIHKLSYVKQNNTLKSINKLVCFPVMFCDFINSYLYHVELYCIENAKHILYKLVQSSSSWRPFIKRVRKRSRIYKQLTSLTFFSEERTKTVWYRAWSQRTRRGRIIITNSISNILAKQMKIYAFLICFSVIYVIRAKLILIHKNSYLSNEVTIPLNLQTQSIDKMDHINESPILIHDKSSMVRWYDFMYDNSFSVVLSLYGRLSAQLESSLIMSSINLSNTNEKTMTSLEDLHTILRTSIQYVDILIESNRKCDYNNVPTTRISYLQLIDFNISSLNIRDNSVNCVKIYCKVLRDSLINYIKSLLNYYEELAESLTPYFDKPRINTRAYYTDTLSLPKLIKVTHLLTNASFLIETASTNVTSLDVILSQLIDDPQISAFVNTSWISSCLNTSYSWTFPMLNKPYSWISIMSSWLHYLLIGILKSISCEIKKELQFIELCLSDYNEDPIDLCDYELYSTSMSNYVLELPIITLLESEHHNIIDYNYTKIENDDIKVWNDVFIDNQHDILNTYPEWEWMFTLKWCNLNITPLFMDLCLTIDEAISDQFDQFDQLVHMVYCVVITYLDKWYQYINDARSKYVQPYLNDVLSTKEVRFVNAWLEIFKHSFVMKMVKAKTDYTQIDLNYFKSNNNLLYAIVVLFCVYRFIKFNFRRSQTISFVSKCLWQTLNGINLQKLCTVNEAARNLDLGTPSWVAQDLRSYSIYDTHFDIFRDLATPSWVVQRLILYYMDNFNVNSVTRVTGHSFWDELPWAESQWYQPISTEFRNDRFDLEFNIFAKYVTNYINKYIYCILYTWFMIDHNLVRLIATITSLNPESKLKTKDLIEQSLLNHQKESILESYNTMFATKRWAKRYSGRNYIARLMKRHHNDMNQITSIQFCNNIYKTSLNTSKESSTEYTTHIALQQKFERITGLLLIGTRETAIWHLVHHFGPNVTQPVIEVSQHTLLHSQLLDPNYDIFGQMQELLFDQQFDLVIVLDNILDRLRYMLYVAKVLSPSMIWLPELHEYGVPSGFKDEFSTTAKYCVEFWLLNAISYEVNFEFNLPWQQGVCFVGSSNDTYFMEPAFVCSRRFQRLGYLRVPDTVERQQILLAILDHKTLHLQQTVLLDEIVNPVNGYAWPDLINLANEVYNISLIRHEKAISMDTLKQVAPRKVCNTSLTKFIINTSSFDLNITEITPFVRFKDTLSWVVPDKLKKYVYEQQAITYYNIGKAISHSVLGNLNQMFALHANNLVKAGLSFYFVSISYLKLCLNDSSIIQFKVLSQILHCLSGYAARDACIIDTLHTNHDWNWIHKRARHEFQLAFGLCEALCLQLGYLDMLCSSTLPRTPVPNGHNIEYLSILNNVDESLANLLYLQITPIIDINSGNMFNFGGCSSYELLTKYLSHTIDLTYFKLSLVPERSDVYRTAMLLQNTDSILILSLLSFKELYVDPRILKFAKVFHAIGHWIAKDNPVAQKLQLRFDRLMLRHKEVIEVYDVDNVRFIENKESTKALNQMTFFLNTPILNVEDITTVEHKWFTFSKLITSRDMLRAIYETYGKARGIRLAIFYKEEVAKWDFELATPRWLQRDLLIKLYEDKVLSALKKKEDEAREEKSPMLAYLLLLIEQLKTMLFKKTGRVQFLRYKETVTSIVTFKRPPLKALTSYFVRLDKCAFLLRIQTTPSPNWKSSNLLINTRFYLLTFQDRIYNEMSIYSLLVESYCHLVRLFVLNSSMMEHVRYILLTRQVLSNYDLRIEIASKMK